MPPAARFWEVRICLSAKRFRGGDFKVTLSQLGLKRLVAFYFYCDCLANSAFQSGPSASTVGGARAAARGCKCGFWRNAELLGSWLPGLCGAMVGILIVGTVRGVHRLDPGCRDFARAVPVDPRSRQGGRGVLFILWREFCVADPRSRPPNSVVVVQTTCVVVGVK